MRNDALSATEALALRPSYVVMSPGPCTPNEAGICMALVREADGRVPILGVCLGHQAIGQAFGARIRHAREVMHGKTSAIHHAASGPFRGLPDPFEATRYHSLVVERDSLPACLVETAWTVDAAGRRDEVMGLSHAEWPVHGVQFHPESILTQHGHALLRNFLEGSA